MSDKVKPWHQRKPKHGDDKRKRVNSFRAGDFQRIPSISTGDSNSIAIIPEDDDDWNDAEYWEP